MRDPRPHCSAASNAATSSVVCAADNETRSRAVPCGTVGGRMAGTQKPRSRSASAMSIAARSVTDDSG
jgi:hypothetical protein